MAGLRAEATRALNTFESLFGKEGITSKYRPQVEKAITEKGAVGLFEQLREIYHLEAKVSSGKSFEDVIKEVFKKFSDYGSAHSNPVDISTINSSPALEKATNKYIETANAQHAILKEIQAEAAKTPPVVATLVSKIQSLNPLVRTTEMNQLLIENKKTGDNRNEAEITRLTTSLNVIDPEALIGSGFTEIGSIATADAEGKYTRSKTGEAHNKLAVIEANKDKIIAHLIEIDPATGTDVQSIVREFNLDKGTVSTEKPITASVEKLKAHLEGEGPKKVLTPEDITSLTACLSSTGEIDTAKLETLFNALADRKEGDKTISKADQQKAVFEAVKASTANKLKDATVENFIDKLKNPTDTPDGKGGWGETLLNIGKTALTSGVIVAAAIFFIVTGQLDKFKKLISGKADQQEVVQLAQQMMATEQQDIASVKKSVNEVRYAIERMKDGSTKRVAIKQKSKRKTRNNAPEGHEQANTTRMNAKSGHTKVRMNAEGDEEGGLPTDSMNDTTGDNTGSIENDLPPVDDGMNQDMNPAEENDQVDGNNDVVDENQNDGNNQVGDEDGGDSAANSTIDGQPNSTRPMEGGNQIKPISRRRSTEIPLEGGEDGVVRVRVGKTSLNFDLSDDTSKVKQVK
jgi:hypothetical protein